MTDDQLRAALEHLGIEPGRERVVALLPLVQVAWADGAVHPVEQERILAAAAALGLTPGTYEDLVRRWVSQPPSELDFLTAQRALVALAERGGGAVADETLDDLISLSVRVAEAAGGLFGRWLTVSEDERKALGEIAHLLRGGPG